MRLTSDRLGYPSSSDTLHSACNTCNQVIPANAKHMYNAGPTSKTLGRRCRNPANTKHLYNICTTLYQRRRRWADVVQMLYKCFVFAGMAPCLQSFIHSFTGRPTNSLGLNDIPANTEKFTQWSYNVGIF